MFPGSYSTSDWQRLFMSAFEMSAHLTAQQMEAFCMMFQPALNITLGPYDKTPVGFRVEGLRKIAALHPTFKHFASRFPDTMIFQYGLGQPTRILNSKGFDDVTFAFNAAQPYQNLKGLGF